MITRRRSILVVGVFAACLVAAASCTTQDPPSQTPCEATSECGGKLCVDKQCAPCADSAACTQDAVYGAGAQCENGSCVACRGQVDCACEGTNCASGSICRDAVCRACTVGEEDCTCFGNNTCSAGLSCTQGVCTQCPAGAAACACLADGGCNEALECMANRCVPQDCVRGQLECPCRTDPTNACNEGLTCLLQTETCGICTPDTAGCACAADNTCQAGLVCNLADHTCRVTMTCQQVMCGSQQVCMAAGQGTDARCLSQCNSGFMWNATTMACDAIPAANCNAGAAGSILAECTAQNRGCTPTTTGAMCGNCHTDFVDDNGALATCRAAVACAMLTCTAQHRVCVPHTTSVDAVCGTCETGYITDGLGTCVVDTTANCRANDPHNRLAECAAQNQTCQESATGATCGGCVTGYAMDSGSTQCVRRLCSDATVACAARNRSCSGEPLAVCGACLTGFVPSDALDTTNTTDCRLPLTCAEMSCPAGKQCLCLLYTSDAADE